MSNDYKEVLPNLSDRQNAYIEQLKVQTGIDTVISRINTPTGTDDLIIILPSVTQLNGWYDDDDTLFFPNWDDLDVIVVTDQLLDMTDYQVKGFRVSSVERKFLGNKVAVTMSVQF